jgi:hypothetical protein
LFQDAIDMTMLKKDLYNVPNIFHIALEAVTLYKQQEFEKLQGHHIYFKKNL